MNDKKALILDTALELFSEKGYHSTSMQDIATKCQIAKGSLYTYFQSKDELFMSIIKESYVTFTAKMMEVERETDLTVQEKFEKQLYYQLNNFMKYRDFIQKHMQDPSVFKNKDMGAYMMEMRTKSLKWTVDRIIKLYGNEAREVSFDAAVIFSGIMKEYVFILLFDVKEQDLYRLARFLMSKLDDIVTGSLKKKDHYLSESNYLQFLMAEERQGISKHEKMQSLIKELKELSESLDLGKDKMEFVQTAIKTIEEQIDAQGKEKEVLIEGMLLYLEKWNIPKIRNWVILFREHI
ncbi:TetR/AcrR family transcriptional regulator [Peribacillus alkalitolerans]|uniref:TetR/AcrR family transcriptional regulator n=1 Tax=Peribacillus alkalitolerans TaxID=1550385 RepID=UPI0013D8C666|nr:TetR/AcrR family transcriptional regulator [Peribacillus alkalitolerans]